MGTVVPCVGKCKWTVGAGAKSFTGVIRRALSFISVSMTSPQHLERAHRRQLASQMRPPLPLAPLCILKVISGLWCYFGGQEVSLLFTQSHRLACSAALDRALMAWR